MKRALISDIHSNIESLEAVLADIREQAVDEIYCLGDLVGYGLFPMQVIDLLRERRIPCVRGNHDRWAEDPNMAGSSSGLLSDDAMAFLAGLPRVWNKVIDGVRVAMCHGTPKSDMDSVVPGMATAGDVRRWLAAANADVLIVAVGDDERTSREAWAPHHLGDRSALAGRSGKLAAAGQTDRLRPGAR